MNRTFVSFPITDFNYCRTQLLQWANSFNTCCLLDNNHYSFNGNTYECLLGAGVIKSVTAVAGNAFTELQDFCNQQNDWLFGHLAYDLKNELELLHSQHADGINFPDLYFFIPEFVILLSDTEMLIGTGTRDAKEVFNTILHFTFLKPAGKPPLRIYNRFSRNEYIHTVHQLHQHIGRGDCYEINFCQEFYAHQDSIYLPDLYASLSAISPNPYAAYYKADGRYCCCASPERYLRKEGRKIISQPVKGTIPRYHENEDKDIQNKEAFFLNSKERAENVMIVDLVRNDLSKVCEEGTVAVNELFGIYTFPQVHHMISTVSGVLREDIRLTDIIKATFPIGSMTGAPKKRVLELIEKYEKTRRGLFSGSIGYITPDGDFDFNVVIRSILYNRHNNYLSYQVGSGITFYSDPEKEYEECLIKAEAIKEVLE